MLAIIQEIASKSYTFREVAAYVTIAVCMSFAVGFLIAAFTRIFKERTDTIGDYVDWSKVPKGYNYIGINGLEHCSDTVWMSKTKMSFTPHFSIKTRRTDDLEFCPKDAISGQLPPWRESLRRRPL